MDNPPKLILAGGYTRSAFQQQFNIPKLIEDIKDKVILKGKISDQELVRLYNEALFFLFTSDYEGFGLPILEAARCKTPALVREEAKIPKEIKECGITVPTKELPKLMYKLVKYEKRRKKLAEKLYKKSLRFDWRRTVEKTIGIYKEVLQCE